MPVVHWFFCTEKNWIAVSSCCFLQIDHVGAHKCSLCTHALTFAQRNCIIGSVVSLALELESEFCFFPAEALFSCCCKVVWRRFYSEEFSLQKAAYFLSIHLFALAWSLQRETFWKWLCLIYNDAKQIDRYLLMINLRTIGQARMTFRKFLFIVDNKVFLACREVSLNEVTVLKAKATKWLKVNSCLCSCT